MRRVHEMGGLALRRAAAGVLAVSALATTATSALAQRASFVPTLFWESGLIDTPAAWVSPLGSDLSLHVMRVARDSGIAPGLQISGEPNYNFSLSTSLWGRAEVGASIYTSGMKAGLFAKGILWDQLDGTFRTGLYYWMPSVAVGIRNVGSEEGLTRWGELAPEGTKFTTTLYAVATRTVVLGAAVEKGARAKSQLTLNAGVGSGWFADDAGLGSVYGAKGTGGVFAGAKVDVETSRFSNLSLMLEHNGWDVNLGAVYEVRGLRVGAHLLELGAGDATPTSWAHRRVAISAGWQTNLLALVRGNKMEARVNEIERERDQLMTEIRAGQARVQGLEAQLRTVEGATEADRRAQRDLIEQKLREEQEALRRLQERLNARKPPI